VRSHQIEKIKLDVANNLFLSREQLAIEQQRRQSQSQLLSMLMHELKTPLSIIDMAVTTQKNDARTAGYVSRSVANIKSILDRCIQTDRMVEHEFKLQSQPVQLSQQLRAWVQERKEEPSRFDTDIADGCLLSSDIQCLQIIVNNLIDNAFKHGDPLGQVQLNLSPSLHADGRAGVLLCVVNQPGPSGWPDPDQLFGKYYRSGAAQRVSGTGLGLYLAHNLAGQLGGSLRFAPNHSNIRFELWLPA
jgi:signal transduction histidine kinase